MLATVKEIEVYENKIDLKGVNLQILVNIESNKAGNPDGVPSLISMWRLTSRMELCGFHKDMIKPGDKDLNSIVAIALQTLSLFT